MPTWGRVCSAASRRLRAIWWLVKTSAMMPSAIAAHAAHTNQVLDSTLVTPCQLPWIHPMESIPPLISQRCAPEILLARLWNRNDHGDYSRRRNLLNARNARSVG